jgi:Na+:H+ antiporter
MSMPLIFSLLGGLLVLAFVANRFFRQTRIPDAIVLMAVGLVMGPVLGWLNAVEFQPITQAFGTLAVILILFEAGLDLDLRDTIRHFPSGLLLGLVSYLVTLRLISLVVVWNLDVSVTDTLLIGATLACTSSSITVPILQQIEVQKPARITMLLEASMSDAFAVLTVGVLLGLEKTSNNVVSSFAFGALFDISVSIVVALVAATAWSFLLPKLSEQRF